MKYRVNDTEPVADHTDQVACCNRAAMVWAMDEILLAGGEGRTIPTAAVDNLPPWRARLVAAVAVRAGGQLEHGTIELVAAAARKAGGNAPPGWWRAALGLPPPEVYVPPPANNTVPVGWTVANP